MPNIELEFENRIAELERGFGRLRHSLHGDGTIINKGKQFSIDMSISVSELLRRIQGSEVETTRLTPDQILFGGSNNKRAQDPEFYWDGVNKVLNSTKLTLSDGITVDSISDDVTLAGDNEDLSSTLAIKTYTDAAIAAIDHWDRDAVNGYLYPQTITDFLGVGTNVPTTELEVVGDITSVGTKWTSNTNAAMSTSGTCTFGNGRYVAMRSSSDEVQFSEDGINWKALTMPANQRWSTVCYGLGLFVAVSTNGANQIATSPDGENWTPRSAPSVNSWQYVCYGKNRFVAVAVGGGAMVSYDGITWTGHAMPSVRFWRSVCYGNDQFVAVANNGTASQQVATSPDGENWTARTAAADKDWRDVVYGNGKYVAVAEEQLQVDAVMTSEDGITWESFDAAGTTTSQTYDEISYGNGVFVAVGGSGGTESKLMTSPDGENWLNREVGELAGLSGLCYGDKQFVCFTGGSKVFVSGKQQRSSQRHDNTFFGDHTFKNDFDIGGALEVIGNISIPTTNNGLVLDTNSKIYYDGTDLIIDPDSGGGSGVVRIGATSDNHLNCGKLGNGIDINDGGNFYNMNLALNTTKSYRGTYNIHIKTSGVTNHLDSMYADQSLMQIDQNGGIVGPTYGHDVEARLSDGVVVGTFAAASYVTRMDAGQVIGPFAGLIFATDARAGTIDGSVYGIFAQARTSAGLTQITGDVYGIFLEANSLKDPDGSGYALYINDLTNIDYCIYQNGTTPSLFQGKVQIASDSNGLELGASQDATHLFNGTDLITDYDSLNSGATDYRIQENGTDRIVVYTGGDILVSSKIAFTQVDLNEYIDSLADGYIDYRATTAHRFGDGTNQAVINASGDVNFDGTARIDWSKYTAATLTVSTGTLTGTVSDLQTAFDGNFVQIAEAAATPGIVAIVDFTSITAFNWVMVKSCYKGSATHSVGIQLYNWTQTRWDSWNSAQDHQHEISTADGYIMKDQSFFIPTDTEYIGTGGDAGEVRVRFYHTMAGNASHDLYIDVVALYQ